MERARRWLWEGTGTGSGPAVAWLFQRLLALLQAAAFASLAVQVRGLIGSRGILPWAPFAELLRARQIPFAELPSLLRWITADPALVALAWVGVLLALLALVGLWPRLLLGLNAVLYLSFVGAGRELFTFQWDAMLIESSLLAAFLPTDRRARWVHLLFRVLLFKLYFESGLAKWNSALGDWQSGAAMTLYYETAPLPTALAWFAHHLPVWWHHLESWGALVLELLIPLFIFGPRTLKRVAFASFSAFQVIDLLTANYGFFCYLSLALHVFLLDDRDLPFARPAQPPPRWGHPVLLGGIVAIYLFVSTVIGVASLLPRGAPMWSEEVASALQPFWAINAFHLFGSITTERIEPLFETREGERWTSQPLRYKPGPPDRAPPFVAPHQPRLDFLLWFYGLRAGGRPPAYVVGLLKQLCIDAVDLQRFFPAPLPQRPDAVRIRFARYTFTSAEERRATGNWWHVQDLGVGPELDCARVR